MSLGGGGIARVVDLGRRRYAPVLALQRALHAAVADGRLPETWLVVEHEPVVTFGRKANAANLLVSRELLAARGVDAVDIERGGDVTYHGPGQVVMYPIRKLDRFRAIVPLVSAYERAAVRALADFGIAAGGRPEHRGVYVADRAICAVGLAVQRMTSLHGLALNACTALDYNRLILPCGTPEFGITSISRELGREVSWAEARDRLVPALAAELGVGVVLLTSASLEAELAGITIPLDPRPRDAAAPAERFAPDFAATLPSGRAS